MFDSETIRFIADAPPLDGVDLAALPQELTNAYAAIVAARIRLHEGSDIEPLSRDITALVSKMKRLAFAHEALVAAAGNRPDRAAAAFVAGSAHHVSLMAERVRTGSLRSTRLGYQSVSPEVSATLLFLVAEASADAAEMAKLITPQNNAVKGLLLRAIVHLAHGRLRKILDLPVPTPEQILSAGPGDPAVQTLYFMLFEGVRELAQSMLGESHSALPVFERVRALCVEPLPGVFEGSYSVYPGPLHLASLLSSVANDLSSSALVRVPPPGGIDGGRWLSLMREIAENRPYLWRNHREAIRAGYLEPGVSAAISFPTGAGKSTLAELKIAAALLRGVKVVFLAPTVALVEQTARTLGAAFRNVEVQRERAEELLFDFEVDALPPISVMTPERCLAMLSFDREVFAEVGLLIFDECHLLHPREMDRSRRAIDAMLCVLNFNAVAPKADLLFLSAMMMNCEEIAGWLQSLTGRRCLPLSLTWKPTRQVRGCVVYGESDINQLKEKLREVRASVPNKHAPAALQRTLKVQPFGFFCLHQTWRSNARKDYTLIPLLDDKVTLSTGTSGRDWYLTPNGIQVAASLAVSTARKGLKTLVFTQTIPLANSAATTVSKALGASGVTLSESERLLLGVASDEAGGSEHLYIEVNAADELVSASACHHGLLLPAERHLHESLFRRPDGIAVLVATSTLSQGMNLPSEVVIIAGDSRFDPNANRVEKLEAHELLNAAGRAGRAGEASHGFVLVIPSKVVHFNDEKSTIHKHWTELRAIFSQSDQCLVIDDPLTGLLDQIHSAADPTSELAAYLLKRLPVSDHAGEDVNAPARQLLGRSFAAYRARVRGDEAWVQARIEAALFLRQKDTEAASIPTWADRLAASAAVPVDFVRELGEALSGPIDPDASVVVWRDWFVAWLTAQPQRIPQLVRRESLEGLFGASYAGLIDDHQRGLMAAPELFALLQRWMAGETLVELERAFGTKPSRVGKCEGAREFVVRVVPELAYVFSVPAQVVRAWRASRNDTTDVPVGLQMLGSCVKEGFDRVEKLALRYFRKGLGSRRAVHREFAALEEFLEPPKSHGDFAALMRRVEAAVAIVDLF